MTMTSTPSRGKAFGAYIATDPIAILQAHFCLKDMGKSEKISSLLLDGPPGVGKTYLGKHLSGLLDAELLHFQVFPGCDRSDMLWDSTYTVDGEGTNEGILLQAIRLSEKGKVVLILDELDKSDVRVDSFLLNFLNEGFLMIPQLGTLRANTANLMVVITKNDLRDASPPLLRRCRVVYMDWPTVDIESRIIMAAVPAMTEKGCAALLELANRLRINPEIKKAPSTNEMMRVAPDLLEMIQLGSSDTLIGEYYINSIAQNVHDRRFIEKSPIYIGLFLREALSPCVKSLAAPTESILQKEVNYFVNE